MTTMTRTYPQPDSPLAHIGPHERALAVFKYLLDLEPEVAKGHKLFACIVNAFDCEGIRALKMDLAPSLVEMIVGEPREIGPVVLPGDDAFKYKPPAQKDLPYPAVPPLNLEVSLRDGRKQ